MGVRDWISSFSDKLTVNTTDLGSIGDDAVSKLKQYFSTEEGRAQIRRLFLIATRYSLQVGANRIPGGVALCNIFTRFIHEETGDNLRELTKVIMELEARVGQLEKDGRLLEEAEQVKHCAVAFPCTSPNVEVFSSGKEMEGNLAEGGTELADSVPVSLYSHTSYVPLFNGLNFSTWWEHIQFHLGVLDLDSALQVDKPPALTDKSSDDEKALHKAWERSNRLSLMFMRMTVANNLKGTLTTTESAKEFKKLVEKKSQIADKSLAGTLMSTLITMKYDGSRTMHEHVFEMTTLAAKLENLGMNLDEFFLVQFILNSLPSEQYGPFKMNYNTINDKWNIIELTSMLVQEEARLKNQRAHCSSPKSSKS